jgi:uncharacterized protein
MQRHLVIFARTPELGRVKRRLGRDIGLIAAARFYRSTLIKQIRHLSADRRWTTWLFVTPDNSLDHPIWRGAAVTQGQGDLGQRMLRPFRTLPPGHLVLVGSDIPAMRCNHIARAFTLLGRHDLVFGPASDGGFWLVGSRRTRPMPAALFDDVRWSSAHALSDVQARIPARYSVALADILDDVDTADDLRRLSLQRL